MVLGAARTVTTFTLPEALETAAYRLLDVAIDLAPKGYMF